MSSTIFLKPNRLYDIGGKTYTLKELQEHAIDSMLYKKQLKELNNETE